MDMKYVPLVCYYDGKLQENTSHPTYVGGHMKADRVRLNICFTEFVGKMHELCKSLPEEANIFIKCRYLLDQHNSIAMAVEDDISLSIIMDLHPHQCNAIVVYIEQQPHQKSSNTSHRLELDEELKIDSRSILQEVRPLERKTAFPDANEHLDQPADHLIDIPSRASSLVPQTELDEELEVDSTSTLLKARRLEYETAFPSATEHLENPTGRLVEDFGSSLHVNPDAPIIKCTDGNKDSSLRSRRQGSKRYSNQTRQFSRSEVVEFQTSSKKSNSCFTMRVLDPKDLFLQRWNKIFFVFSVVALAVDALFFYTPGIDGKKSCLNWNESLEITACVLRSIADIVLIGRIVFKFRTGYEVPSSRVFGGEIVQDLRVIASRYLSSTFLIDVLAVLPVPQILVLIMPGMRGSMIVNKRNSLWYILSLQYIPRFVRVYSLYKELRLVNKMTRTIWAGVVVNFSLYMLASHIFGAFWYLLSIEREIICWRDACRKSNACNFSSLYCGDHNTGANKIVQVSCPTIEPNSTLFDFGIYLDALQCGIPTSSFLEKLIYCFWWALRNIGSFGQNLKTSAYTWEIVFAIFISVSSLFLFMLLMGNVQTYLQSETVKSEKAFRKRLQDTDDWMSRKFLPQDLRQRIRQYELFLWQTTRGFDEDVLLHKLPKDIRRDVKRHSCLALLKRVPMFEVLREQSLDALCDKLKPVHYAEDNIIMREGHPVDEMIFIMKGELSSWFTNGGNIVYIAGDFMGEELLSWAFFQTKSSKPTSTRTVQALKEVEAFALMADDLKAVVAQFILDREITRDILKFYSQHWRTWAASFIQAAWRRYCRKKKEKAAWRERKITLGEGNKIQ